MSWNYAQNLVNGSARNAGAVTILFDELKIGLENIDTTEINFLTEGAGSLKMDPVAGHNHDGVNSRVMVSASSTLRGGLLHATKTHTLFGADWDELSNAYDFNASSGITTILYAVVMWRDPWHQPSAVNPCHPDGLGGWTNHSEISSISTHNHYQWVIDDASTPDRLFVFNEARYDWPTLHSLEFKAWMIGL